MTPTYQWALRQNTKAQVNTHPCSKTEGGENCGGGHVDVDAVLLLV